MAEFRLNFCSIISGIILLLTEDSVEDDRI